MSKLSNYEDKDLLALADADIGAELRARGYEYGWYKKIEYVGHIYIFVNADFPNLVKIGYSNDVETRLKQLSQSTGVPSPYHCYAVYSVKKSLKDLNLHKLIDTLNPALKHTQNKEFFEMTKEQAYDILAAIAEINGDMDRLVLNPFKDEFFIKNKEPDPTPGPKPPVQKPDRAQRLSFQMLGIPVGSVLVYRNDHSITAKTCDMQTTVMYQGQQYKLSALVRHLKNGGSWQGGEYFDYNGRKLTDIRKEIERRKEENDHGGQQ